MAKEAPLGGSTAETDAIADEDHRIGLAAIVAAFFWLGVTSFGGNTAAWLYHQIVQRRRWIKDTEFLSDVALGRIMPGSGGVNLMSGPLVIVVALAMAYTRIGRSPTVHGILDGIAAAAIGLTFATGLKLLPSGSTRIGPLAVTLATVLCVGILRWPMLPVVLCLAPVSIGLALASPRAGR